MVKNLHGRACGQTFTRLFINLGSVDGFSRGDLLGFICNNTKISGKTVGKIDVKGVYSFFEVQNADVDKVFSGFKSVDYHGRDVRIEISGDSSSETRGGASNYKKRDGDRREKGYRNGSGYNGDKRERNGSHSGGGFRDFSGKRREDRRERRRF